jgi:hypothetical protein
MFPLFGAIYYGDIIKYDYECVGLVRERLTLRCTPSQVDHLSRTENRFCHLHYLPHDVCTMQFLF